MKTIWSYVILSGLVLGVTDISQAYVHVWLGINPFPVVVVAPVVVQPVMVQDPYAAPPPDYRQVLADFHHRVERMQKVLDRQFNRRVISREQYDRHANDLDGILRLEQQDAAQHNGALTPREVNDLNGRLTALQDRIHEDLAR
jgi:hypothetical protein